MLKQRDDTGSSNTDVYSCPHRAAAQGIISPDVTYNATAGGASVYKAILLSELYSQRSACDREIKKTRKTRGVSLPVYRAVT